MIERARELGGLKLAAILAVTLVVAGGAVWALADRDDSASTTDLAVRAPEPGPGTPSTTPRDETDGRADRDTGRKRERDRGRERGERDRATRRSHGERAESSTPAGAQAPEPDGKSVDEVAENLLGGGDPDRGSSQPAPSDLPPEVRALIQGGDEQGSANPPPGLEELLEGGSGGN
ncbi:MAG: hypothetical protein ACRDLO_08380 [Solirubrobacterales bacterium]